MIANLVLWLRVLRLMPWPKCTLCRRPLTREYWRRQAAKPFGNLMVLLTKRTGMCVECAVVDEKRLTLAMRAS